VAALVVGAMWWCGAGGRRLAGVRVLARARPQRHVTAVSGTSAALVSAALCCVGTRRLWLSGCAAACTLCCRCGCGCSRVASRTCVLAHLITPLCTCRHTDTPTPTHPRPPTPTHAHPHPTPHTPAPHSWRTRPRSAAWTQRTTRSGSSPRTHWHTTCSTAPSSGASSRSLPRSTSAVWRLPPGVLPVRVQVRVRVQVLQVVALQAQVWGQGVA